MESLYILLVPFIWLLSMKFVLRTTLNAKELAISLVVVSILVVATIELGKYGMTQDTEVWNGKVASKDRVHGTYEESYSCNCKTDSKGNSSCSTCYRTHYTVDWIARTTVGKITFKSLDSTWRTVYNKPDPARYTQCKVGEPAAIEHRYTNYVQAVPNSLFHDDSKELDYTDKIPAYPRVYDFYRYNRVINVDSKITAVEVKELDRNLDNVLKYLGASKQANIIVILTEIDDPTYRYAVENAWQGGEKNDVVIFIGLDGQKITWVDVMTWALNSGNEMFHVTMRDNITAMKEFNVAGLTTVIPKVITELYDRPHMADYEYLADEIDPPTWVIWLALFFAFGGSAILTYVFHKHEI
jgi:hypothetical protein